MHPWFVPYLFDFVHPCNGQLTSVNTRYPLTSIMSPYRSTLELIDVRCFFFKFTFAQVHVLYGSLAHVRLTCCNQLTC